MPAGPGQGHGPFLTPGPAGPLRALAPGGSPLTRPCWLGPQVSNGAATSCIIDITSAPVGEAIFAAICLSDSQTSTPAAPSGWSVLLQGAEGTSGASSSSTNVFSRVKQAGDTTFTFSWAVTTQVAAIPFCYPGADTSTIFESATYLAHTSGTAYPNSAVTPAAADRMIVLVVHSRGTTSPGPSPFAQDVLLTERADFQSPSNPWSGLELCDTNAAVTQAAHTYTCNSATTSSHGGVIAFALLPATAGGTTAGTAALSGSGTLGGAPQFEAAAGMSGSGTLTAAHRFEAAAALTGQGTLTAAPQFQAAATLSGLGSLTVSGLVIGISAVLSGVGTLTAAPVLAGSAALSGSGTLSAAPVFAPSAVLSGSGTLVSTPAFRGSASLSGLGTLTAAPRFEETAALSGSGTLSALWALSVQLALSGSGTLSVATGAGAATLTGTGSLTGTPAFAPAAALAGSGTLTAAPVLAQAASLSGTGTLTGGPVLASSAVLAGAGTLTAAPVFAAAGLLSGLGTLTAAYGAASTAALSGLGTLTGIYTAIYQAAGALSGTGTLHATPVLVTPGDTGTVIWMAWPAPPRWHGVPADPQWAAGGTAGR